MDSKINPSAKEKREKIVKVHVSHQVRRVATRTQKRNCVHVEKSTKMKIRKLRTFDLLRK